MKRTALTILILAVFLAGCGGGARKSLSSFMAGSFPPPALTVAASDVAGHLSAAYPPGRTSIYLAGADGLAMVLENQLRAVGFTILAEPGPQAKTLAWTLDELEPGVWYLTAKLSDGYQFSRVYRAKGQSAVADGGLARTGL